MISIVSHDSARNAEFPAPTSGSRASGQDELLAAVYDELRSLARHFIRQESPGQTLSATGLVHEAYLRLSRSGELRWEDDRHFYLAAAQAMRRILVDRGRRRRTQKRGGDLQRIPIAEAEQELTGDSTDFVRLDEALSRFTQVSERAAQVIMLRFFAGLDNEHAARLLGISPKTALRDWRYARAWLAEAMRQDP
jgi:RNA polymerase sigma factor (TIGR02999 family)